MQSSQMEMDRLNDALPSSTVWQEILSNWATISGNSSVRHFALPQTLPKEIRSYLARAHAAGKASVGTNAVTDYSKLYPPSVTDLQALVIEEALSLGQGLSLEASRVTNSSLSPSSEDQRREAKISESSSLSRVLRPSEPEKFDGSRALFGHFITRLQLQFRSFPSTFTSDEVKIRYAGSYLTGNAYTWFKPHVNQTTGDITFVSFTDFIDALRAAFDDPDEYATAERELDTLKQDGSCATYYAKIVSLFSRLGWTESKVKIHHFRTGLKDSVKDALIGKRLPTEFTEYATNCISLDNEIFARLRERRKIPSTKNLPLSFNQPGSNIPYPQAPNIPQANNQTVSSPYPADPMVLDNSEAGKAARKAYRWANNLCGYCGKANHKIATCPTLAARSTIQGSRIPKTEALNTELFSSHLQEEDSAHGTKNQ